MDPSWGVQEQKAEQRSTASRGKEERQRERNKFSGPHIFQNRYDFYLFSLKKVQKVFPQKYKRLQTNDFNSTKAEKRKDIMFVILSLPERKNESKEKV